MNRGEVKSRIEAVLGERIVGLKQPSERRLWVEVAAEVIPDATRLLYDELGARLQTASATDGPREMEILYHWALDALGLLVVIRTRIDRDRPEIASITGICPAAEWIEREMWELLGIQIQGHPDLRHLLLQDDWPEGNFPLRREDRVD